jgi:very-short-patch-repair endonuclease
MILSEKVMVNASAGNKNYWVDKGYHIETYKDASYAIRVKRGTKIEVLVSDLPKGSHIRIDVQCDFCKRVYNKEYRDVSSIEGEPDACSKCVKHKAQPTMLELYGEVNAMKVQGFKDKAKQTNLERYGVENVGEVEEFKEKAKQTNLQKYGCEYTFQSEEVKDKIKATLNDRYGIDNPMESQAFKDKIINTNQERYGVDYYTQTDEYLEKSKQTNLDTYGCEHPFQSEVIKYKIKSTMQSRYGIDHPMESDEFKQKIKDTCMDKYGCESYTQTEEYKEKTIKTNLKKYGCEWVLQSPEIRAKISNTLYVNGTAPSSKQQNHLCELFNGILNKPIHRYFADIVLEEDKIIVEYDGGGHDLSVRLGSMTEEYFYKKEMKRNYVFYANGYRLIRIVSPNDKMLADEEFLKLLDISKEYFNSGRHWITINIKENKWKCSQFTSDLTELLNN